MISFQGWHQQNNITEASKGSVCIRCDAPDAYSCHYNGPMQHWYGKGRGKKCHDLATAELCMNCDEALTEGKCGYKRDEHSEEFLHWCMMTNIRREERGLL